MLLRLLLISLLLAACSTPPPPAPALVPRDIPWVAALVDRPKGDRDRVCIESSLDTGLAMLDFLEARFTDPDIKSALLKGTKKGRVRTMRERDFEAWRTTHSVASLSEQHLIACLQDNGHQVARASLLEQCFYVTEPAAMFLVHMRQGKALPVSIVLVKQSYKDLDIGGALNTIGKTVFASALVEQTLESRYQAFARCLRESD